jgi:serine/threonine-protein kinase
LSQGTYAAIAFWSFYIALEPAVRRRWPHTLISWTRLLSGRFVDPLVARDVLVGILGGLAITLAVRLSDAAPLIFGRPPSISSGTVLTTLSSFRHVAHYFLMTPLLGVLYSLSLLLMLYMARALLRRDWLAQLAIFAFAVVPAASGAEDPVVDVAVSIFFAGLAVSVLTRVGLLASSVLLATFMMTIRVPLTLDPSVWYSGRSFVVLGSFVVLLATSAYVSLGGKPLFGKELLD